MNLLNRILHRNSPSHESPVIPKLDKQDLDPNQVPVVPPGNRRKGWLTRLRPGTKRDAQLAHLQLGYQELVGLIRSIREQLDRQVQSQDQLLNALEQIPPAVDGINSLAKHAAQQGEVIDCIRKQFEENTNNNRQLVDSMQQFNKTLRSVDDSNRSTSKAVAGWVEHAQSSEKMICNMMERSEKRMSAMVWLISVLALLGFSAALYLGLNVPRTSSPNRTSFRVEPKVSTPHSRPSDAPSPLASDALPQRPAPDGIRLDRGERPSRTEEPSESLVLLKTKPTKNTSNESPPSVPEDEEALLPGSESPTENTDPTPPTF